MGTVRGEDASVYIYSGSTPKAASVWGISDFSLTFDRGTVEQELVGEKGNYHAVGSLSMDGSYTACKFAASANADSLSSVINSHYVRISGATGSNLTWFFASCQITGYDVAIGDADTITEASIDFVSMIPYNITMTSAGHITDSG